LFTKLVYKQFREALQSVKKRCSEALSNLTRP